MSGADGYQALTQAVGWAPLPGRSQVELAGRDRTAFLQNFCTQDLRRRTAGQGTEAFVLNAKGHVLAHVLVFVHDDALHLDGEPGLAPRLTPHLERYVITEDVRVTDRSSEQAQFLLAGPQADGALRALGAAEPPQEPLDHCFVTLAGVRATVRRVPWFPHAFALAVPCDQATPLEIALRDAAPQVSPEAIEALRIETGFPAYGRDITLDNLPQEVDRDAQAISFTKGCYLGQETVARIDALGHVNRLLRRIALAPGEVPAPGAPLTAEDKPVGAITSAAWSPRRGSPVALAYVRRGFDTPGAPLACEGRTARVWTPEDAG